MIPKCRRHFSLNEILYITNQMRWAIRRRITDLSIIVQTFFCLEPLMFRFVFTIKRMTRETKAAECQMYKNVFSPRTIMSWHLYSDTNWASMTWFLERRGFGWRFPPSTGSLDSCSTSTFSVTKDTHLRKYQTSCNTSSLFYTLLESQCHQPNKVQIAPSRHHNHVPWFSWIWQVPTN